MGALTDFPENYQPTSSYRMPFRCSKNLSMITGTKVDKKLQLSLINIRMFKPRTAKTGTTCLAQTFVRGLWYFDLSERFGILKGLTNFVRETFLSPSLKKCTGLPLGTLEPRKLNRTKKGFAHFQRDMQWQQAKIRLPM